MGKPTIRFEGYTDDWEQRKFGEIVEKYEDPVETPTEGYTRLGIRSHAKGTFHSYVEKGKELETAKMFRVAADKFIVNITFGWEHAVAITDENDAGKLVSHRFPQYSFNAGMEPKFFRYLILDENFKHHLELSSPGGAGRNRVLKLSDMLQYKMNFPSEAEQKKIAAYFDDLDHLITLHHRKYINGKKEELLAWEQRKLDDVVEFLDTMRKPLEGAKRISGPYPYYGASGIVDYVDGYLFDEELILLSEDGANITDRNYPVCFLASGKYWVNNHAHVLRTKQGNENNFICNSLERKDYTQYNTGMAMPKLNKETCKKIPILCPGFEEQKKIGDYFRSLDNLITLHQRKCEETKKLKKFMLQKMFPKKGEKVPEIRFGSFTDDWEQRKLDDVVEFLDTMRKPLEGAKRISGPYPYYGASGIVDYVDGYLFDEELILLSEDGANITDRNYPVCFLASGKYWVNNHAHVLRTKQGNENNFICNSLERKDYTQYNTGMAMPKLNKETCKKIPILCPGFEEQKKIGDYFRSLDNLITLHQHKCEELQNIKKFMLQNMFI